MKHCVVFKMKELEEKYWTGRLAASGAPSYSTFKAKARVFDDERSAYDEAGTIPALQWWKVGRR